MALFLCRAASHSLEKKNLDYRNSQTTPTGLIQCCGNLISVYLSGEVDLGDCVRKWREGFELGCDFGEGNGDGYGVASCEVNMQGRLW